MRKADARVVKSLGSQGFESDVKRWRGRLWQRGDDRSVIFLGPESLSDWEGWDEEDGEAKIVHVGVEAFERKEGGTEYVKLIPSDC